MAPSSEVKVPSGASHVTSSTFDALASARRAGSATIQSSLHQPGSAAASSQVMATASPSRRASTRPASTSAGDQEMGLPARTGPPGRVASKGQVPSFTSHSRNVGPRRVASALARISAPGWGRRC